MDERVLKWITPLVMLLTVSICAILFFMPQWQNHTVMAMEEYDYVPETSEDRLEDAKTPEMVVEATNEIKAQLQIELPEGTDYSQINIENNYLTQKLYLRIPTKATDYFSKYSVRGTCDHIEAISYYQKEDYGVIVLALNQVYEIADECANGYLYLNFIDPHELYDKIIVVDAGHGGRDGGASKQGVLEKNLNLEILKQLKAILDENTQNIGVYYTRTEDVWLTLDQRVQLANKANADLFISIHNNASSSGHYSGASGTQVLYSQRDTSVYSSERFAGICLQKVTEQLDSKNQGLVKGDKIYIIRTSEVPVALIEVGFMTNREELSKLNTVEYQQLAAEGIYEAIIAAFEEGY